LFLSVSFKTSNGETFSLLTEFKVLLVLSIAEGAARKAVFGVNLFLRIFKSKN
jgi:hypothetical protein